MPIEFCAGRIKSRLFQVGNSPCWNSTVLSNWPLASAVMGLLPGPIFARGASQGMSSIRSELSACSSCQDFSSSSQ
ncbi:hypothetical protein FBQ85_26620 [Cytophagia bacterium CHB2]|nr:hypothetical protein [Cytophagia bacterium CHB2]